MTVYGRQSENKVGIGYIRTSLLFGVLCVFSLAACCIGCRPKASTERDVNEPNVAAPVAGKPAETVAKTPTDKVIVTVNGVGITEKQLDERTGREFSRVAAQLAKYPPAFAEQLKKQFRQKAIENLINEQLLSEKVKEAKIEVTDQEVTEHIKKLAAGQNPPLSLEDFKLRVEAQGVSLDEAKQQIGRGLGYQKLLETQWAKMPTITEADAQKYYSENAKQFEIPDQVRASHILITSDTSDPNADPNVAKAQAKAKAEDLLKQIKAGGDFAELAKAHSACPSSAKGGDLDFFARGQMVEPFEKTAFVLKPGEISDVVETKFGYHIIKLTDRKDAGVTSFEQAKDGIIREMTDKKRNEIVQDYIQSLKDKASIVYAPGQEPKPQAPAPLSSGSPGGR